MIVSASGTRTGRGTDRWRNGPPGTRFPVFFLPSGRPVLLCIIAVICRIQVVEWNIVLASEGFVRIEGWRDREYTVRVGIYFRCTGNI
jgi:hypothetical protein